MINYFTQLEKEDKEGYLESFREKISGNTPLKYIPLDKLRVAVIVFQEDDYDFDMDIFWDSGATRSIEIYLRKEFEQEDKYRELCDAIDIFLKPYEDEDKDLEGFLKSYYKFIKGYLKENKMDIDLDKLFMKYYSKSFYKLDIESREEMKFDAILYNLDGTYDRVAKDVGNITFYKNYDNDCDSRLKYDIEFKGGFEIEKRYLDGMYYTGSAINMLGDTILVTDDLEYAKSFCYPSLRNPLEKRITEITKTGDDPGLEIDYKSLLK